MTKDDETRLGDAALKWWRGLQPRPDGSGGNRGALARLRRAATATEAALEPEAIALCRVIKFCPDKLGDVAIAASVLAHVRDYASGLPFARMLGAGVMSPLRFRRLVQSVAEADRLPAFRRAVALSGGKANVRDLAVSLLDWDDPRRRQRWLYAFYDAPAPDTVTEAAAEPEDSVA